jgi:hypothetical protein
VLVDTPVWSFAYRSARRSVSQRRVVDEFAELIRLQQAWLIGPVRQEILTGFRDTARFAELRATLRAFVDIELTTSDYEQAADIHNTCSRNGIQGSPTDFLICAVARRQEASVYTTDRDFTHYAKLAGVRLHNASRG